MPQQIQRFGTRELLADEPADKAASANFPARFHPSIHLKEVAPGRSQGFARQNVPEHHAPAIQELAGEECDVSSGGLPVEQSPASRSMPRSRASAPPFPPAALGIDQGAQIFEAITRDEARGGQFPQAVLDFTRQAARGTDQFVEERSAV